MKPVDVF
jgi:CMP-N-acetylneuraminic acid synthetase